MTGGLSEKVQSMQSRSMSEKCFAAAEPADLKAVADGVARRGAHAAVAVSVDGELLGVIALSDVLKLGIRERITERPVRWASLPRW